MCLCDVRVVVDYADAIRNKKFSQMALASSVKFSNGVGGIFLHCMGIMMLIQCDENWSII